MLEVSTMYRFGTTSGLIATASTPENVENRLIRQATNIRKVVDRVLVNMAVSSDCVGIKVDASIEDRHFITFSFRDRW